MSEFCTHFAEMMTLFCAARLTTLLSLQENGAGGLFSSLGRV